MEGSDTETQIKLMSSDGQITEVKEELACKSLTIKNMLEDIGEECTDGVPLPSVNHTTLTRVVDYLTHYENDPAYGQTEEMTNTSEVNEWDQNFTKDLPQSDLFELILAANYLDIKPLLDMTCKTVANMIKGKSPEEIRTTFGIKNDFTPEEQDKIREENKYMTGES